MSFIIAFGDDLKALNGKIDASMEVRREHEAAVGKKYIRYCEGGA
jgi:hypothetical protein